MTRAGAGRPVLTQPDLNQPMPHPDTDREWAALVTAELKALPPIPAPATLGPRVMEMLRARAARHWWMRVWWEWPRTVQIASALVALSLASAIGSGGVMVDESLANYSARLAEGVAPSGSLWDVASSLWEAVGLVWAAGQAWVLPAICLTAFSCLAFVAVGAMCMRSTLRRA